MVNQAKLYLAAIYSLAFLWIFTGLTSAYFSPATGYQILASAGISGSLADAAIYAGSLLDLLLGLWLLSRINIRLCCLVQIIIIVLYSALLTMIDASFWLHPFGPVTKNIPIIVLIVFVYSGTNPAKNRRQG